MVLAQINPLFGPKPAFVAKTRFCGPTTRLFGPGPKTVVVFGPRKSVNFDVFLTRDRQNEDFCPWKRDKIAKTDKTGKRPVLAFLTSIQGQKSSFSRFCHPGCQKSLILAHFSHFLGFLAERPALALWTLARDVKTVRKVSKMTTFGHFSDPFWTLFRKRGLLDLEIGQKSQNLPPSKRQFSEKIADFQGENALF